jgi:hypothetical protein
MVNTVSVRGRETVCVSVGGLTYPYFFPNTPEHDIGTTLARYVPPEGEYTVTLTLIIVTPQQKLLVSADGYTFTEQTQPANVVVTRTRTLRTTDLATLRLAWGRGSK